jgi:putative ABC transport system permease protein
MLRRLRAVPGVRSASISSTLPLQQEFMRISVRVQGRPDPTRPEDAPMADFRSISPDYFAVLGIRVAEGRGLSAAAREDGPRELLVNESFAHRYCSGGHAVGQHLNFMGPAPWEIVGVVNDVRYAGLTAEPFPEVYIDYRQASARRGVPADMFFAVRTTGSPLPLMANVRGLVRQEDPQLAVGNVATMEQRLSASVARPRFYAALVGVFAFLAVALATVGIYGVLSYSVSQCTREIGIRLALGAPRREVLRLVLWQGCAIAGIGIAIGLAGAAALTRSLSTLLFGITRFDPPTFVGVSVLLAAVAMAACYVPARRATRVDPILALRAE